MDEDKIIQERKKKLIDFIKNKQAWVLLFLVIAVILGVYIRSLPMQDHSKGSIPGFFTFIIGNAFNGQPGLWDITTNTWTLGPDLDPWLFTRYAKTIVETGGLPEVDNFRSVPLGFNTKIELPMVSYMIVFTYKLVNMFGNSNVEFAAVLMPVLFFGLTIISFFLFVREIFYRKDSDDKNIKANLIAIISTFFMIVIPVFLSRTVAGIPEKESIGFFFMFLSFYLFLKSWRAEKNIPSYIFAVLAGISTALMGLSWGGVVYIYITIAIATLVAFILNKVNKKESIIYLLWLIIAFIITFVFTTHYTLKSFITSLDTGIATLVFSIILINALLIKLNLISKISKKIKLPQNITSIIVTFIFILILVFIFFGPSFILEKLDAINHTMFNPVTGRWSTTVAENRQPDFKEWSNDFGPFIKNIPIMFWLFIFGSILLFKNVLDKIKKKHAYTLMGFYVLFLMGLIFSRFSSSSIFNGDNFISKSFYYCSALIFIGSIIYFYIKYSKSHDNGLEKIDFEYILLFSLFILCLFSARGAVRLIMVLGPISTIFASYLSIELIYIFKRTKDELMKVVFGFLMVFVIILMLVCFFGIPNIVSGYYPQVKAQSYSFIPSYYNQQWQKAMDWIRNETPKDAVFAHWWDYGYWVQSIGNRATVLDGGNAIVFWNYYMGRLVLTGDNQKDALDFLYNHNATYLLIDSSDIGKYGAFASIGSDANYDRFSWIGTFLLDKSQTQETNNQTFYIYTGGTANDEDLKINESGKEVFLPKGSSAVAGIILPVKILKNNSQEYSQPYTIMYYKNQQYKVNLRYLSIDGKFIDFKSGIEACAFIFPSVEQQGNQVGENPIGASMYLSPRLLKGFLAQKYILDDPFNKFPNFKVVHSEPNIIMDSLNKQGMNLPEFVYFQGVQGPIKIWSIKYTGNEKIDQKYLEIDYSKYLSWEM